MGVNIEIGSDGMPSYTLSDVVNGMGERIGYGTGPRPMVSFKAVAVQHGAASLAASKPTFKTVVFMRLQHPGERDVIERPATRADADRFPAEYRAYCQGRVARPDGTPLEVLFPNHPDVVMMLGAHGCYTVEQLADLTDTQKQNLGMGGHEWSIRARSYLKHLADGQGFAAMQEQIKRGDTELSRLRGQNATLGQQVQALTLQVQDLMRSLQAAGNALPMPGVVHQMQIPDVMPAPAYQMQPNGYVAPDPGVLGADDDVGMFAESSGRPEPVAGDAFMEDIVEAAHPDELAPVKRGPGRPRRNA